MFRIPDSERHSHVKFYCLHEREERKIDRERQRSKKKLDASSLHSALTILWLLTYEHEKRRVTRLIASLLVFVRMSVDVTLTLQQMYVFLQDMNPELDDDFYTSIFRVCNLTFVSSINVGLHMF